MFLKTIGSDAAMPDRISGGGGEAWVDYVGDRPVFSSQGTARFVVERSRALPFLRSRLEPVPQGRAVSPSRPLRAADRVRLDVGGETMRWTYDPDANLGRPMRVLLSVAGLGTALSCMAACLLVALDLSAKLSILYYGGSGASAGPVAAEIKSGYADLYPEKPMMSDFLKGIIQARKNGEDPEAFAKKWKADHPMTKTRADLSK